MKRSPALLALLALALPAGVTSWRLRIPPGVVVS